LVDKFNDKTVDYGTQKFIDSIDTVVTGDTTHKQFKTKYPHFNKYQKTLF